MTNSDLGYALTAPNVLSASQVKAVWRTGTIDDGGINGSPSITFSYGDEEYAITIRTVREALGLPQRTSYTVMVGDE